MKVSIYFYFSLSLSLSFPLFFLSLSSSLFSSLLPLLIASPSLSLSRRNFRREERREEFFFVSLFLFLFSFYLSLSLSRDGISVASRDSLLSCTHACACVSGRRRNISSSSTSDLFPLSSFRVLSPPSVLFSLFSFSLYFSRPFSFVRTRTRA